MCRFFTLVFACAYLIAVFLLLVGTFGWFGQDRDPLSGIFLLPLGFPWTFLLEGMAGLAGLWLAVLAPLLNLLILSGFCRWLRQRRRWIG